MGTTPEDSGTTSAPAALQEHQSLLDLIEKHAVVVLSSESDRIRRNYLLRLYAEEIGCPINERTASSFLAKAQGHAVGVPMPRLRGERMDTTPTPWIWEGIVMAGTFNLLIAPPKIGKSAIMVGMIAAWWRGDSHFLGQPLHGECPPVYIVGTDQPENDWHTLFKREGLVNGDGTLGGPIEMLWHTGAPLHLTDEGIEYLAEVSAANPGALFLLDSYHACVSPLAIDEATSAFDGPARDLSQALAPHQASIVVIHHSNKSVSGGNATNASRGSNALPAAASLTILMNWLKQPVEGQTQSDYRIVLKTQGRAKGCTLLAELQDEGWISHGNGADALHAEAFAEAERELTGRQADVFDYIADRWHLGSFPVQANELACHLNVERNKIHRCLSALMHKGLIRKVGEGETTEVGGRPSALYGPALPASAAADTPLPREGVANVTNRTNPGTNPPEQGDKPVENLARVQERRGLSPFTPLSPLQGGGGGLSPLPEEVCHPAPDVTNPLPAPGAPVERLINDDWQNGWVVRYAPNPHHITIEKLGRSTMVLENRRWMVDVRPCAKTYPSAA
jgi:hypothetical protein